MADSLRVNHSVTCDDSLALAGAFTTMGRWKLIYPDDYARACYYYGRMLRNRGDQVAAMRAFVCGIHAPYVHRLVPLPWFTDYHILARIYSNIGSMCHLADEFQLSYQMYESAATQIIKTKDSVSYYYLLNDMALELASQNLYYETLSLLYNIEQENTNSEVLTKLWETKAILYRNIALYDSAIYAVRKLYDCGYHHPTGYIIQAQTYWHLEQYDSALHYADLVMKHPYATPKDKYNMLYIQSFYDSSLDKAEIKKRSEERADIDKEILDPLKEQLVQAITLLRQALDKRSYYINLALVLFSICILGGLTWLLNYRIKCRNKQAIQDINSKRQQVQEFVTAKLKENEQLSYQLSVRQQQIVQDIENTCYILQQSKVWDKEIQWKDYSELSKFINKHFYLLADKLQSVYQLDEREVRLCVLVLLNMFSNDSLAKLLHYGKGIRTYKSRLNAKLGNKGQDLRTKLIQIAVSPSKSSA